MLDSREYDPKDSMEELEPLDELDELELLKEESRVLKQRLDYKIWQLQRLAQFEESIITFGHLPHEQLIEKREILKQYSK